MSEPAHEINDEAPAQPEAPPQPSLEDSVDQFIDDKLRRDRVKDGIPEPAEPEAPKRDYSLVVDTALELGLPLSIARPEKFSDVDIQDEAAIRTRLGELREADANVTEFREAMESATDREYAQEDRDQQALEDGWRILDEGSTSEHMRAASIFQEQHPHLFDSYLAAWTETDPQAASVWSSQNPPIDWEAEGARQQQEIQMAQAQADHQELQQRQQAIAAGFSEREAELAADPKTAPDLENALHLIGVQMGSDPDFDLESPEDAKRYLDASVKTVREVKRLLKQAEGEATALLRLDEMEHHQRLVDDRTGTVGRWNRAEALQRLTDERAAAIGLRGPQPTANERDAAFFEEFDRVALAKTPSFYGNNQPVTKADEARWEKRSEDRKAKLRAKGWR